MGLVMDFKMPTGLGFDLDVVVLGRAGLDLYPEPAGTKTQAAASFRSDLGGSAGNIAVALARLGKRTGLIAPVSADPAGDFVKRVLAQEGVKHLTPEGLRDGSRTSLAIAETRAHDCEVVIYRNQAADLALTTDQIARVGVDRQASVLIATGTALALEPSRSATLSALDAAAFTVLDLDYRAYTWDSAQVARDVYAQALQQTDLVVGNDDEFALLAGDRDPLTYARSLAPQHELLIYKMGERGAIAILPDGREEAFGIYQVPMLKPFGAGDAFMGGLIYSLQNREEVADSVRFGSACAALVVSTPGCASAMPRREDVLKFMKGQTSHPWVGNPNAPM